MRLRTLLRSEARWVRHNLASLVLVLLVLPAGFAVGTVAFQEVIPTDTPVGIVPADDSVTEDELTVVKGGATTYTTPIVYENEAAGTRALQREEVYGLVVVPPGLFDADASGTFRFVVDEAIVPYEEPSRGIAVLVGRPLNDALPADVSVRRETIGGDHTLSEYLVPVGLMLVTMLVALVLLPRTLADERAALRRVRVESSLHRVVFARLALFAGLLALPLVATALVVDALGYSLHRSLLAVPVYVLVFCALGSVGLSVALLTNFDQVGQYLTACLLFGLLLFSNLVYPLGFFSPLRMRLATLSPLHYAMVVTRSLAMKDVSVWLFADYLAMLAAVTAAAFGLLHLSIRYYASRY